MKNKQGELYVISELAKTPAFQPNKIIYNPRNAQQVVELDHLIRTRMNLIRQARALPPFSSRED